MKNARFYIPIGILMIACLCVIGCASHTHTVGYGPGFDQTVVERQWYLLYGLVPINEIDTKAMAGGKSNYEITTEVTVADFIYQMLMSPATITCRTVWVRY